MGTRTITNLKQDIQAKLHGTSLNKVQNFLGVVNESARTIMGDVDPLELKRTQAITNAIYSDVFNYPLPADVQTNRIIDIRPQVNRSVSENVTYVYDARFDQFKTDNTFNVDYNQGVKTLRLSKAINDGQTLNECDTITSNGTWSVGDDATNLTNDSLNFVSGNGSLNFDTDGSGTTASLSNSTMTAVDLEDVEDQSTMFAWVYMPVAITNATLTWGSSSAAHWAATVTANHDSTSFQIGWNLLAFEWNGATETGTPDSSAVDYLKMSITYDGAADTDYRLDSIVSRLGSIWEAKYYSSYAFRTSAGIWKEDASLDSDLINFDQEAYNLLLEQIIIKVAPNIQGEDAGFDLQTNLEAYKQHIASYKRRYKSESQKPKSVYYTI